MWRAARAGHRRPAGQQLRLMTGERDRAASVGRVGPLGAQLVRDREAARRRLRSGAADGDLHAPQDLRATPHREPAGGAVHVQRHVDGAGARGRGADPGRPARSPARARRRAASRRAGAAPTRPWASRTRSLGRRRPTARPPGAERSAVRRRTRAVAQRPCGRAGRGRSAATAKCCSGRGRSAAGCPPQPASRKSAIRGAARITPPAGRAAARRRGPPTTAPTAPASSRARRRAAARGRGG